MVVLFVVSPALPLQEMMNAAQKEELNSVNTIRDTLKIFQRIDRIAAFTCITDNPVSCCRSCDLRNNIHTCLL